MPRNDGAVWDGLLTDPQRNLELAQNQPVNGHDLQQVIGEVVATQRGLTSAGQAVQGLQTRLADLQTRLDSQDRETLTAVIDSQNALAQALDRAGAAMAGLLDRLAPKDLTPLVQGLSGIQEAVAGNQAETADAIKTLAEQLAGQLAARDELLADFGGDLESARWWIEQARRFQRVAAAWLGFPEEKAKLLPTTAQTCEFSIYDDRGPRTPSHP